MNFIYIITNLINGKQYVGSHCGDENDTYLGSGKIFLKAYKKYGKENFKREILEECPLEDNLIRETYYIQKYNTLLPFGYNISPTGGHGLKGKLNDETKEKIRNKQKGKKKILYFIEKYGEEEGRLKYDEWIEKVKFPKGNIPWLKDKHHSKEANEKNRKSHLGKKYPPLSEEHKRKIGEANKKHLTGHKQSKETIEKRRQKHLGRKNTEETKRKMSLAAKGKPKNYDVWNKNKTKLNITPDIINEVKKLKDQGLLQREIAEKKNYSISAISRILNGFYDNKEQISRGK
jgi:group I intron endonuclease